MFKTEELNRRLSCEEMRTEKICLPHIVERWTENRIIHELFLCCDLISETLKKKMAI